MKAQEIKSQETIRYLEKIFSGRGLIVNPTRLDIPNFGEVTATSTLLFHYGNSMPYPYFDFKKKDGIRNEFFKKGSKYFVTYHEEPEAQSQ